MKENEDFTFVLWYSMPFLYRIGPTRSAHAAHFIVQTMPCFWGLYICLSVASCLAAVAS